MTLMDEPVWRGKIFSGGRVAGDRGHGGDAADIWLANAAGIERWGIRESGKIPAAMRFETHVATQEIYEAATLPSRAYEELQPRQTADDEPDIPLGGPGASGTGARFGGTANLEAFTETRWVTIRGDIALPLLIAK